MIMHLSTELCKHGFSEVLVWWPETNWIIFIFLFSSMHILACVFVLLCVCSWVMWCLLAFAERRVRQRSGKKQSEPVKDWQVSVARLPWCRRTIQDAAGTNPSMPCPQCHAHTLARHTHKHTQIHIDKISHSLSLSLSLSPSIEMWMCQQHV